MQYVWNQFVSSFFIADVGAKQDSALSPILSALYIVPILHIFEKKSKNILSSIWTSIFSFVDNSPFISQEKSYEKSNTNIFCSYNIIFSLFNQFGLVIEHNKSEVFHFLMSRDIPYILLLNL